MTRRPLLATALAAALLAVAAAPAAADPAPGLVEVRDAAGALVGEPISGPDAIQAALARVAAGRADPAAPWSVVAGAGVYGDFVVAQPNVHVRAAAGATVTIDGTGGTDDSSGSCFALRRGASSVTGIDCRNATARGVVVSPPPTEGGAVLRDVSVTRARSDGIAVTGGADVLLEDVSVTTVARDGISLSGLTGPGPYRVSGGSVRSAGDDGIDLANDAQRVQITGVTVANSRGNGVESDDAGSVDLLVQGAAITRNQGNGVLLGGSGARLAVVDSEITGNKGYGVSLGAGSGFVLRGDRFNGSNAKGDLFFSQAMRAGGVYENLRLGGATITLPGEPSGVIVSAAPSGFRASRIPTGLHLVGRYVRVKDGGSRRTSVVTLRWVFPPALLSPYRLSALAIHEDDPPGNARVWQPMPNPRVDPIAGTVETTLTDAQIASGSDARFAAYAPLAPLNDAPAFVGAVYPREGSVVRGRVLLIAARATDDGALGTGNFALYVDGRRRGGVSFRDGQVVFRVRLSLGLHRVRLLAVDSSGLMAAREWSFTVRNVRPTVLLREAVPKPGSRVRTRGRVTIAIPVRDDLPVAAGRVRLTVDGRAVRFRLVRGRVIARVVLRPGRHRAILVVRDRDGARVVRPLAFRTIRP